MAEAILVDQAKTNDRVDLLRGLKPSAEDALRAVLSGTADDDGEGPEAEVVETTNIVSFADWLSGVARGDTAGEEGVNA